jgi:hypothetical protein
MQQSPSAVYNAFSKIIAQYWASLTLQNRDWPLSDPIEDVENAGVVHNTNEPTGQQPHSTDYDRAAARPRKGRRATLLNTCEPLMTTILVSQVRTIPAESLTRVTPSDLVGPLHNR